MSVWFELVPLFKSNHTLLPDKLLLAVDPGDNECLDVEQVRRLGDSFEGDEGTGPE